MPEASGRRQRVYLDLTHVGRQVTGLERIAIELFEKTDFDNADVRPIRAGNLASLILKQQFLFPLLALLHPNARFVFPGFPPSPLMALCRERVVLYVHDLFLITRRHDLGLKARIYMAAPFAVAIRHLKHFLTNSIKTRGDLQPRVTADAHIALYRPTVANVFGLGVGDRADRPQRPSPLRIVAVGTIEPRKNYAYAAQIRRALDGQGYAGTELHVIGRPGWGEDAAGLASEPGVFLHGYLGREDARRVVEDADIYLSTAHDEGLGLPLLEAQFAGLPVVAVDIPVFHEVLGSGATFIPSDDATEAAAIIAALVRTPGWRRTAVAAAKANLSRWNAAAEGDGTRVRAMFASATAAAGRGTTAASPNR